MNELEERWRDLGDFIREQRRVGQLSLRKLSEMAGISNPYLSQIERGLRKPSAEILRQIAQALQISAETLYVRAGILEVREGDTDLVAEIRRDPYIGEQHKKALVHIYESFRAEHRAAAADDPPLDEDEDEDEAEREAAGEDEDDDPGARATVMATAHDDPEILVDPADDGAPGDPDRSLAET